jgi:Ala-tRNA(Pro) deacylase
MMPAMIVSHLREHHPRFEHHTHDNAMTAQDLAAVEHVSGYRVAKPVVVKLDGKLAIAVVAAADHVRLGTLEEATATRAELVRETEFGARFEPCEPGAEPPLALFGVPIFVDEKLLAERRLLMPAGTHRDAIMLDTHEWLRCEHAQAVANLGAPGRPAQA